MDGSKIERMARGIALVGQVGGVEKCERDGSLLRHVSFDFSSPTADDLI